MSNRAAHTKNRMPRHRPHVQGRNNWKVTQTGFSASVALAPGQAHDPFTFAGAAAFWDAVQFAARCLRGETDPAALP